MTFYKGLKHIRYNYIVIFSKLLFMICKKCKKELTTEEDLPCIKVGLDLCIKHYNPSDYEY